MLYRLKAVRMELWRERLEPLDASVHLNISADEHLPAGVEYPWTTWKALNRLRTQVGRSRVNMSKWGYSNETETCDCGIRQTKQHLLVCPMMNTACSTQDLTTANGIAIGCARHCRVETKFKTNVCVYKLVETLEETKTAELVRRSLCHYPDTMYANLYETHFSYIQDIADVLPADCVCYTRSTMVLLASHMILISSHTDILHDPHVKQICTHSQHTSAGLTILNVPSSPKQLLPGMPSLNVWSLAPHWMRSRRHCHWGDRYHASVFEHTNLSCF